MNKKIYKRIEELNIPIKYTETFAAVLFSDVEKSLKDNKLSVKLFNKYFGVQTCPIVDGKPSGYCWDVEAVLERMLSGELTGTQAFWD